MIKNIRVKNTIMVLVLTVLMLINSVVIYIISGNFAFAYIDTEGTAEPDIVAQGAIVYCEDTGEIVYSKNATGKFNPYSITKLFEAYVMIEELDLDEEVTVSSEAAAIGGSTIYLMAGEVLTVRDLLYGSLLASGNDAAYALAEAYAGTGNADEVVALMNEKAKELGCENTNFLTVNGLSNDEDQYTTAEDLLILVKAALSNETIYEIASALEYVIPATNVSSERELESHLDQADDEDSGVLAGKTGYWTEDDCSIALKYSKNDLELIVILLGASYDDRTDDANALFEYAHSVVKGYTVATAGDEVDTIWLKKGEYTRVKVYALEDVFVYTASGKESDYYTDIEIDSGLTAPLEAGDEVGTLNVIVDGEVVSSTRLVVTEDVSKGWIFSSIYISNRAAKILIGVIVFAILLIVILRIAVSHRTKANKQKRREAIRKRAGENGSSSIGKHDAGRNADEEK